MFEQLNKQDDSNNRHDYHRGMVVMLGFSSVMGGLLFGYDTGIIGGVNLQVGFSSDHPMNTLEKEQIVSIAIIGALIGSLFSGLISDRYGRKPVILISDLLFILGSILMFKCNTLSQLVIGRFIVGMGIGIACMVVPVYIAELAPTQIRGKMVTLNNLFTTGGQFLAYFIALFCGSNWHLMLGIGAIPAILQLVMISLMPESPRYLMNINKHSEAKKVLSMIIDIDTPQGKLTFDKEIGQMQDILSNQVHLTLFQQIHQLFTKYTRILFIGCGLQVFQQLSGINTVMYYGPEIIKQSKLFSDSDPNQFILLAAIPLAAINFIGTILAIFFIESIGRRMIMLRVLPFCISGMLMMSIGVFMTYFTSYATIGTFINLSGLVIYLLAFAIGLGATPWTVNSEIYPLHLRGQGASMSTSANWIANYAISALFLTLTANDTGRVITYSVIAFFNLLMFFFVYAYVPETKGKTLQENVDQIMNKQRSYSYQGQVEYGYQTSSQE